MSEYKNNHIHKDGKGAPDAAKPPAVLSLFKCAALHISDGNGSNEYSLPFCSGDTILAVHYIRSGRTGTKCACCPAEKSSYPEPNIFTVQILTGGSSDAAAHRAAASVYISLDELEKNPPELLEQEAFAALVRIARERYDYVLIDTPPIGSIIDAAIIAKQCDGAILVIESELVSYRVAVKAKEQLAMSGCRILGAVLNKVDTKKDRYYSKYSQYYQSGADRK